MDTSDASTMSTNNTKLMDVQEMGVDGAGFALSSAMEIDIIV